MVDHATADRRAAELLPKGDAERAAEAIRQWNGYEPTPLVSLPGFAARCGVEAVWCKDEGPRFGLGSFKALGGAYAIAAIAARADRDGGELTVASATDGNHGRSVAWGAQRAGCRCVIYLHEEVSQQREDAIAAYGAEIVRTPGNYDDSSRQCMADAAARGWTVVSDTAPGDDPGCALEIMQGYSLLVFEAVEQLGTDRPTHVLLQSGCGGMAGAIRAHLRSALPASEGLPTIVVVEPVTADCLYRSAEAGERVVVEGAHETIMAGLAVGETSAPAWEILGPGTDAFLAIDDTPVVEAMRLLAEGESADPPIVAGETGAAGLAGLLALADAGMASALGLGEDSRVLAINTEADTDPEIYTELVGRPAAAVRNASDHAKESI